MNLKICEIVTDFEHLNKETLEKALDNNAIKDYAYIIHDKDLKEDGTTKYKHYHISLRFKYSQDTKNVAKWFNVSENFVSKIKGRYEDSLLYLIHANAPEKYQYSIEEVKSNFNYVDVIQKYKEKKEKGNNSTKDKYRERKEEIINMIDEGIIREWNKGQYITAVENVDYANAIDRAFKFRTEKLSQEGHRNLQCIFITGESGAGKTTYAQELAKKHNYSYYVSSGSNDVLDDYKGQDCLILDDLRPSCMGLSDLLKLLDNHTQSSVKSRYKNKVLECKLIIITTTLTLENFFNNVFSEEKETIIQLQRRCTTKIVMTVDNIFVSFWKNKSREYSTPKVAKNPVKDMFTPVDITEEEEEEYISNFLGLEMEEEKQENNSIDIEIALSIVDTTIQKNEYQEFFRALNFEEYGNKIMLNTNGRQLVTFEYIGSKSYLFTYVVEVTENNIKIINLKKIQ